MEKVRQFFELLFYKVFYPGMVKREVRIHNKPVGYVWIYPWINDNELELACKKYLRGKKVRSVVHINGYVNFLTTVSTV